MALMARMRDLAPAFIISVGVIFILFMVISDSKIAEIFGQRSNNVGSVNGENITYQKFNELVDKYAERQKQQSGQEMDPDNMDQFRDQIWDLFVDQLLTEQEMKKYGITVTDAEIYEVVTGENPPEMLKQNFMDSTGNFNRQAYLQAIKDPKNKASMIQAENMVRQQLIATKLQSILTASITVSEDEIRRKFADQNVKLSAEYVMVDVMSYPDSLEVVTDKEMKKYFDDNADKYKQEAARKVKYVSFNIVPSRVDSNAVEKTLASAMKKINGDTAKFRSVGSSVSESPITKDTIEMTSMPKQLAANLGLLIPGSIVGPVSIDNGIAIYHVISALKSAQMSSRASHILIPVSPDTAKDYAEAMRIYEELKKGANFAELASKFSKDPGSAQLGGDLGWFTKGRMVPEFENAVFNGNINEIQKPVKTQFGWHIIKVTGRGNDKFVVEKIVNLIKASAATKDDIYQRAQDFVYVAEKNGFDNEAKTLNYPVTETPSFAKDATAVQGLSYSKNVIQFAFDNSLNTISTVLKIQSGYVVAKVSEVQSQGVRDFEKAKVEVKSAVAREKKFDRAKKDIELVKANVGDSLKNCYKVNPKARFNVANDFTLAGPVPTLGNEYLFASEASKLPLNQVSAPIKGLRGYYLIRPVKKVDFNEQTYLAQRNTVRDQLLQETKTAYNKLWIKALRDRSDIVDHRSKFYGR